MAQEAGKETMTRGIEPVRKTVTVPVSADRAFRRFTAGIDGWWPKPTHSVSLEDCRRAVMEERQEGRVYEVDGEGGEHEWGVVTVWDPPRRVAFTWHPGRDPGTGQEVEVTFTESDGHTRVELVHSGWERYGEGAAEMRARYVGGWDHVLGLYAEV